MTIRAAGLALLLILLLATMGATQAGTPARRIVSLSPHLTELAFDAGAGDWLVGVVEHSDYPPEARRVARIGDAFRIDRERLASLRPDLILAWQGGTPEVTVEQLVSDGYRVELIQTDNPEDIAAALEKIADLAGTRQVAAPLAEEFRAGFAGLERRFAGRDPVRVFVQISPRPLYTVGHGQVVDEVISMCGGVNVFGHIDQLAPVVTEEAVIAADPQVIIAPRAGDKDVLGQWRQYESIPAVHDGQLYSMDADLISRQSLRLLQGAREICDFLQTARGPDR
jgi:iron complex transport system substrate-binding protein